MEMPALAGLSFRKPTASDAELLAVFTACRNPEFHCAIESGHGNFRSEHRLPWRDFQFVKHIRALRAEMRMRRVADA